MLTFVRSVTIVRFAQIILPLRLTWHRWPLCQGKHSQTSWPLVFVTQCPLLLQLGQPNGAWEQNLPGYAGFSDKSAQPSLQEHW